MREHGVVVVGQSLGRQNGCEVVVVGEGMGGPVWVQVGVSGQAWMGLSGCCWGELV
jgi:hypothetical protein